MFSTLLYFLVALVIYTTSELFKNTDGMDRFAAVNVLLFSVGFVGMCHLAFKRLERLTSERPYENMDYLIQKRISRLSVAALILFAVNIYGFKLTHLFSEVQLFEMLPTLKAVLFIGLFLFYLLVIWNAAYPVQNRYFAGEVSKKDYILSNISFSLPALMPWLCLSLAADLINLLPWQPFKDFLKSPIGEIGYIVFFMCVIAVFGPVFIRKMWNCKPLTSGYTRSRIENICKKTGLSYSDILKWDLFGGNMMTAGVMGFIGRFRYLLVTPALTTALSDEELDAVMLHEIGHVQRYHMVFYLLFFAGFMACSFVYFEPVLLLLYLFDPAYKIFAWIGIERATAHPALISIALIGTFLLYFRFIFGFFMRNFEREADLHIYQYTRDASALISTFYKIASYSRQSMNKPNWHHYSIGQRIEFLEKCDKDPFLIRSHHSKVRKMVAIYLIGIVFLLGAGYSISSGGGEKKFDNFIAERILFRHLEVDPANSDLYVLVGDYYYGQENYARAIDSYENILRIDPMNIHALNNLSMLFSTCPDEAYRNSIKALEYAKRALRQKREPYVLDTYAEALFANHDIKGAIAAEREALNQSKENKKFYEDQLRRFEKMLIPEKLIDQ
ncbi:MAG: peptidase [Desulfobacula sp. RIFOXYB2_FULL_45_6]|nr:MAG: peptidase [Desulfobacula sp. RIFOXYB2_FULL_45_6]